jgi:hypothetical protein
MRKSHKNFDKCSISYVKDLLLGSNYFGEQNDITCECTVRHPVYNTEWDSEYREHFDKVSGGLRIVAQTLEKILTEGLPIPHPLQEKIDSIPKEYRKDLIDIVHEFGTAEIQPFVDRVYLKISGDYKGYIDFAPIGEISEVFLKPPAWMKTPRYYVTCKRRFNPNKALFRQDEQEEINCVPYVRLQEEIGVCAQYAVRLALIIMSTKPPTVPELTFNASRMTLTGGVERPQSRGWNPDEITQIIEREGYSAFRYGHQFCRDCNKPLRKVKCAECSTELLISSIEPTIENIYAYIESGIPVLIGVKDVSYLPWWPKDSGSDAHALVGIGHTISDTGKVDGLIVHDVSKYPYQVLQEPLKGGEPIENAIIEAIAPVYREVTVDYSTAKELALDVVELDDEQEYRPILVEADKAKSWLADGEERKHFSDYSINKKVLKYFSNAFLDRYVWVFEIKRELGGNKRIYEGDVIISATRPEVMGFNLPLERTFGFRKDEGMDFIEKNY